MGRIRQGSIGLLSVFALGGWGACSAENSDAAAASSLNRPTPATPSDAPGAVSDTPAPGGVTAMSTGTGAPTAENALPENLVMGGAGSAGTRSPAANEAAAGAVDAGGAVGIPLPACEREVTEANKAIVSAAIDELFVRGDITAADRYWGEPYLQHNPGAASGVATFRNLFGGLISPGNSIYQLTRIIGECDLVLIHGDYTSFGGATFDMFRVAGGRLVEHWDAAAIGAGPNPSGHTALDGESVVRDVTLTGQNEALVLAFVENVLIDGAYDAIGDYMSPALIEHNPEGTDGSEAYVRYLQERAISYRQIRHQMGDGNFVFVLSEGAVGTTNVAHYDLFRLEGARIVEHWDGRREVPPSTQSGLGIF